MARIRTLLATAMAATLTMAGCAQTTAVAPQIQSDDLKDVLAAKGGRAAWSLIAITGHDNDLSSSDDHYREAAQQLARIPGLYSATALDTPGTGGIELMGFNGQWFAQPDKEVNTGSADFVGKFLDWTGRTLPAENVVLALQDHGGGIVRGIMVDESSGNQGIDIPDLAAMLGTHKVTAVMFDACLMNMVEVAYELKGGAQYVIGSESVTYAGSWPYADIGRALAQGGNPETVATRIVDAIGPQVYRSTISGISTAGAANVAQALDQVARVALPKLKADPRFKQDVAEAIGAGQSYKFSDNPHYSLYNSYRDLPSTMRELAKLPDADLSLAAKQAEQAARKMVLKSWRDTSTYPDTNGVSVYAPIDGTVDLGYAKKSAMARDTQWDEFLVALNSRGNFGNPLQSDKYPKAYPSLIYPAGRHQR